MDFQDLYEAYQQFVGLFGDIGTDPNALLAMQNFLTTAMMMGQADAAQLQTDQAQFARDQMGFQVEEAQDARAFRRDTEMPFQAEQMLQRLEAERMGLDTTRLQYDNQRALEAERLTQMQQTGTHDIQLSEIALETALINKSIRQEELAAMLGRKEGFGRYTPRTGRDVMSPGTPILSF